MRTRDGQRNSGRAGGSTGRRHRREPCRGWKAEGAEERGFGQGRGAGRAASRRPPEGEPRRAARGGGARGEAGAGVGGSKRGGRPRPPALFPPRDTPGLPPHTSHVPRAPAAAPGRARRTARHASNQRKPPRRTTPPRDNAGSGHAVRRGRNPGGSAQRRATPRRPAGRRRGTHPRGAAPRATRPRREPPRQGKRGAGIASGERGRGRGSGPGRTATGPGEEGATAGPLRPPPGARRRDQRRSGSATSTPHDGPRDRAARGTAKPSRDPGGDPKDRVRHEGSPPEGPRRRPRPSGASSPRPSLFSRAATGLPQPLPPQHLSPPNHPPTPPPHGRRPPAPPPSHTLPPSHTHATAERTRRGEAGARGGGLREAAGTGHTGPGRGRGGGGGGGRREGGSGGHRRLHLGGRRAQRPGRPSPRPADDPAHRTAAQAGVAGRPRAGRTPAGRALRGNPQPRLTPGRDTHPGEAIDRQATLRQA